MSSSDSVKRNGVKSLGNEPNSKKIGEICDNLSVKKEGVPSDPVQVITLDLETSSVRLLRRQMSSSDGVKRIGVTSLGNELNSEKLETSATI